MPTQPPLLSINRFCLVVDVPSRSPQLITGERLRKCAWRLLATEELDLRQVHPQNTFARCTDEEAILVAEDTTGICYRQPHKQGIGELGGNIYHPAKALNRHTALANNAVDYYSGKGWLNSRLPGGC